MDQEMACECAATLPANAAAREASGCMADASLGGGETILFVEDETFVREVTCEVLRASGYRVLVAANAADAWREYQQVGGADCLVTDMVLPGRNGRELAAELRAIDPGLKVLLVTGYAEQMELGDCLAKPFSTAVLLRRVRMLLDGTTQNGIARDGTARGGTGMEGSAVA